jgi:hypothetical protein
MCANVCVCVCVCLKQADMCILNRLYMTHQSINLNDRIKLIIFLGQTSTKCRYLDLFDKQGWCLACCVDLSATPNQTGIVINASLLLVIS